MGRIIEAKAVISGEDKLSPIIDRLSKKLKDVGKAVKVGAELDRLARGLSQAQAQMRAIDRFRGAQAPFAAARVHFRAAQREVERVARELDGARRALAGLQAQAAPKNSPVAREAAEARKHVAALERQLTSTQQKVKASSATYERHAETLKGQKRAAESAGVAVARLGAEHARVRRRIVTTGEAIDRQARAQAVAERHAVRRQEVTARRREALGTLGAGAAVVVGHEAKRFAGHALHTYQHFDNERRFGRVVMGLTDAEQRPLVDQAIHMGATTRYNDVQVLEAQRELAARGLKKDQVMGLMSPTADLGMSLDLRLPEAVKLMEGALFAFKKPMKTLDEALASARQTADVQVKAAKISGMTPSDIEFAYRHGSNPARMSGLSEQTLLAFAGISKKANMGGDESGIAFKALVASGLSPTRKAKEALLANGLDYKNYQKNPDKLAADPFIKNIAAQYGVTLNKVAQKGIRDIFSNKALIADPAKFAPAVSKMLGSALGGDDAKSKRSIAGAANRYRDASMKGVDVDRFVQDLMMKIPGNMALANAIFGSKQGGRISTALGDPETMRYMIKELLGHSEGYAAKVSAARMEGFDGAVKRLQGAITNAETKLGRAWDNDGNGGFLTQVTDQAGRLVQSFAELNNGAVQLATVLGGGAAASGGAYGAYKLASGLFGGGASAALDGSAVKLTGAAAALEAAAVRLGGGAAAGAAGAAATGTGAAAAAGGGAAVAGVAARTTVMGALRAAGIGGILGYAGWKGLEAIDAWMPTARPGARFSPLGNAIPGKGGEMYGPPMPPTRARSLYEIRNGLPAGGVMPEVRALPRAAAGASTASYADMSGQSSLLNNTLERVLAGIDARHGRPNDGKVEATLKPDQVQANVKPEQIQATAKLEGKAEVSLTIKVDGPGTVTGMSASSSGNVQANVGTRGRSMPQAAGSPGGY